MTDVVESKVREDVVGQKKKIFIQTSAAAATGHVIDLHSDIADAKGRRMKIVMNVVLQDDAGADKTVTWDPATGIITLGTISTGIHNVWIEGL